MVKKIIVLCDGTWCGENTKTETNIKLIANIFSGNKYINDNEFINENGNIVGKYFEGIGLGTTFEEYIINGAISLDIKEECIKVYKFIVKNFDNDSEIWMFGLSRGAYIIRCVAGMINNCGIINKTNDNNKNDILVNEVYRIYRSKNDEYNPKYENKENNIENVKIKLDNFKSKLSHKFNKPPIKFMGLLDTVGSLGIPKIDPGLYLKYEEFNDINVSSEVQNVYQALSIHDRLSVFEPCFISRSKDYKKFKYNINKTCNCNNDIIEYKTEEVWFPGAHYDIGRQEFEFGRKNSIIEQIFRHLIKLLGVFNVSVKPNLKYSNLVLGWMIKKINDTDENFNFNTHINEEDNNNDFTGDINVEIPGINEIIKKQFFRDRNIDPYNNELFICCENAECNCDEKDIINDLNSSDKYKSISYERYKYIKSKINE